MAPLAELTPPAVPALAPLDLAIVGGAALVAAIAIHYGLRRLLRPPWRLRLAPTPAMAPATAASPQAAGAFGFGRGAAPAGPGLPFRLVDALLMLGIYLGSAIVLARFLVPLAEPGATPAPLPLVDALRFDATVKLSTVALTVLLLASLHRVNPLTRWFVVVPPAAEPGAERPNERRKWRRALRPALLGVWVYLLALPSFYVIGRLWPLLVQALGGSVEPQTLVDELSKSNDPALSAWGVLTAAVIAPLVEEVFFRGLVYVGLRRLMKPGLAVVVSALLFSSIHGNWLAVGPVMALGVLLALAYEKTGTLATPIVLHTAFNAVSLGLILAAGT